jgi:hypothetical protein
MHRIFPGILRCSLHLAWSLYVVTEASGVETNDVTPWRQDQPPNQPYSPQEAISRMTVPEGFTVELVASEPDVVNPIAMSFDDRGRIWITESIEYPRKPGGVGCDRVKLLDTHESHDPFDDLFDALLLLPFGAIRANSR